MKINVTNRVVRKTTEKQLLLFGLVQLHCLVIDTKSTADRLNIEENEKIAKSNQEKN